MSEEPTAEQFLETARKLRVILDYGLAGMLVGDNDIARCIVACETTAEEISQKTKSCNGLADKLPRKEITMRPSSENQSMDYEIAKLRAEIERLRASLKMTNGGERQLSAYLKLEAENERLRAALRVNTRRSSAEIEALISGEQEKVVHASDCAVNNAPALPVGPCDCGAEK